MCCDISFVVEFFCFVLHFVHVMHFISCHHLHHIGIVFLKLASACSCRSSLLSIAFVDPSETNLVLRFPSCLNRSPSLHSASPLTRAPESCPRPDSDSRYRCVRIISKRLQNVSVFLFGLPRYFIRDRPIMIGGTKYP